MDTPRQLYLVACASKKRSGRHAARDLYASPWFAKARAFVERRRAPWFILSAKHGLLPPVLPVEPYEASLSAMRPGDRRTWSEAVLQVLREMLRPGDRVTFLAGERYREHLVPELERIGVGVDVPMKGLAIGHQLAWLDADGCDALGCDALLERFYALLTELSDRVRGPRRLSACRGKDEWPRRGVYFFFEDGELRSGSGVGPRVVRVGTHAVSRGSSSTLWSRLAQHKGSERTGGGSHRGSVFRLLVGRALQNRSGTACPTWCAKPATKAMRATEAPFERDVSRVIRSMPFLWLAADDPPSATSVRARIERNSIALLASARDVDPPSVGWSGRHSDHPDVRRCGIWNARHVDEAVDPSFLDDLERLVRAVPAQKIG